MDKDHLRRFVKTTLNNTTLRTIERKDLFDLKVLPGRRFELQVTPHSTGNDRSIKEAQIELYIDQYHYLDRSTTPSDNRGHNNSYWCAIADLYRRHLSSCKCYTEEKNA